MAQSAATLRLMSDLREMQKDAPEVRTSHSVESWSLFYDSFEACNKCKRGEGAEPHS